RDAPGGNSRLASRYSQTPCINGPRQGVAGWPLVEPAPLVLPLLFCCLCSSLSSSPHRKLHCPPLPPTAKQSNMMKESRRMRDRTTGWCPSCWWNERMRGLHENDALEMGLGVVGSVQAAVSVRVAIRREELKLPALAAESVRDGGYIVGELRTELPRLDPVHVDRGVDVVAPPVIAEGARPYWARGHP